MDVSAASIVFTLAYPEKRCGIGYRTRRIYNSLILCGTSYLKKAIRAPEVRIDVQLLEKVS